MNIFADLPDAPGEPIVDEILPTEAGLSWAPPVNDGGSPIEDYVVECRKVGDVRWSPVDAKHPDPNARVPELEPEVEYEFRVAAQNKAGTGPFSTPVKAKYGKYYPN